jgi:hypothetical protein
VALFPIVKRQNEGFALGYVATRVLEGAIIVVGIIGVLSVVTLRQDFAGVAGADAASLTTAGKSLVAIHDWTFLFGPDFCAGIGNGILLGYLMYTSGLVSRRMALLGVIGGPLAVASATLRACLARERVDLKGSEIGFAWGLEGRRRLILRGSFLAFDAHLAKRALSL